MAGPDDLVRYILAAARIPRRRARRDLERELEAHFADAARAARLEGYDEAAIPQILRERFGDPEELARDLESAYRFERRAWWLADSIGLVTLGAVGVALLILTIQLLLALRLGIAPSHAFPYLGGEASAFLSLALGYVGTYLAERLSEGRLLSAVVKNTALFACLFFLFYIVFPVAPLAAALAYLAGVAVRALQKTALRSLWYLGTVPTTIAACLLTGHLASGWNDVPLWKAISVRWAGITTACYLLTLLARHHEARNAKD
jgi:hypothetical protein